MKKVLMAMIVTVMIIFSSMSVKADVPHTRVAKGKVYNRFYEVRMVDGQIKWIHECVRFKTKDGNIWCLTDNEHHFRKGQKVKITFYTRFTKTKRDDGIKSVKIIK